MAAGYLYVLSNPSIPGLVKVGKTTRDPAQRVAELSAATGVPSPFVLLYQQPVANCDAAEAWVHQAMALRGWRYADNREFFSAPLHEIVALVLDASQATSPPIAANDDLQAAAIAEPAELSEADQLCELALKTLMGKDGAFADYASGTRLMVQAAELGSIEACRMAGEILMRGLCGQEKDLKKAHSLLARAIESGEFDCHAMMAELLQLNRQREGAMKHWQLFFRLAAQHMQSVDTARVDSLERMIGKPGRIYCGQVYSGLVDDCIDDATFAILAPIIEAAYEADRAVWARYSPQVQQKQNVRRELEMSVLRVKCQRAAAL